jgi:hypothetical protein
MFGYMKRKKIEYIDILIIETILSLTFLVDCTVLNKHIQTDIHISWMADKRNSIASFHCLEEHNDVGGMLIYYILK